MPSPNRYYCLPQNAVRFDTKNRPLAENKDKCIAYTAPTAYPPKQYIAMDGEASYDHQSGKVFGGKFESVSERCLEYYVKYLMSSNKEEYFRACSECMRYVDKFYTAKNSRHVIGVDRAGNSSCLLTNALAKLIQYPERIWYCIAVVEGFESDLYNPNTMGIPEKPFWLYDNFCSLEVFYVYMEGLRTRDDDKFREANEIRRREQVNVSTLDESLIV